jgi:hypothetical protein
VAPYVLRRSADLAVTSGHTQGFARSMSNAFVYAQRNRCGAGCGYSSSSNTRISLVCSLVHVRGTARAAAAAATAASVWVCLVLS